MEIKLEKNLDRYKKEKYRNKSNYKYLALGL